MGRGAARAFAAHGGAVTVTSRSADRIAEAVGAVLDGLEPADGATELGHLDGVACDLGDDGSVRAAVAAPSVWTTSS